MKKMIFLATGCIFLFACNNGKKDDTTNAATKDTTLATIKMDNPPAEFTDSKYSDMARSSMSKLAAGDAAGFTNDYADDAVYVWNAGDSVAGKKAITDYWTKRRTEVIDSLKFSNEIYLPIKVNKPQSVEAPGTWVLCWYMCEAKYKTGKKMIQWMHADMHFNADNKIDRVIHYLDRAPINAALAK